MSPDAVRPEVFAFEVSCLIEATTEDEALAKLHAMVALADEYDIAEGARPTPEEIARMPGPYPGFAVTHLGVELYRSPSAKQRPRHLDEGTPNASSTPADGIDSQL